MSVSYEEVAAVAERLIANNQKVTADIIAAELHKAKRDVLQPLKEWRKQNGINTNVGTDIQKYEMTDDVKEKLNTVFAVIEDQIKQNYNDEIQALNKKNDDLDVENEKLSLEKDTLEEEIVSIQVGGYGK